MRSLKLVEKRRFEIVTEDVPVPGPGEVLVRSDAVGICGSDVHNFQDGGIGTATIPFPFTLGHETAGTVVGLGEGVKHLKEGCRVTIEPGINCGVCHWCQHGHPNLCPNIKFHGSPPVEGTFREYFTHPEHLCIPLPDELSLDDGVILEPMAIGVHTAALVGLKPGMSVAVLGCGPVGLLALAVARVCGAGRVFAADMYPYRLDLAERYGADVTINASETDPAEEVLDRTGGLGVDVVIEATTDAAAPAKGLEMMKIGGTLAVIGIVTEKDVHFDTHIARRKGATIKWVRRSKFGVEAAIEMIASGRISLDGLATHHLPLAETRAGFELVENYADNVFKVIIQPQR